MSVDEVISMYSKAIGKPKAYVKDVVEAYWSVVVEMTGELNLDIEEGEDVEKFLEDNKVGIYLVGLGHLGLSVSHLGVIKTKKKNKDEEIKD